MIELTIPLTHRTIVVYQDVDTNELKLLAFDKALEAVKYCQEHQAAKIYTRASDLYFRADEPGQYFDLLSI